MRRVTVEEAYALWNIAGVKTGIVSAERERIRGVHNEFCWFMGWWIERNSADLDKWKSVEKENKVLFYVLEEGDEIPEALR